MEKKKTFSPLQNPWTAVVVVVGGLILLYVVFTFLLMPLYTRHWQRVEVPDVVNLSGRAAEKLLRNRSLRPIIAEIKFDDRMPNGFVVFQNPGGGAVVKKNRRVYITLSKGKRPIVMPKLVGMSERDAQFLLNQNQLSAKVVRMFDSYYPTGVVSAQSIPPQTEVIAGSLVELTVSSGSAGGNVLLPNLVGMSFDEASRVLENTGLMIGIVRYGESGDAPMDHVIAQNPAPGVHVPAGSPVELVLNIAEGGTTLPPIDESGPSEGNAE